MRAAAFLLSEVYDSLLLWRAPSELITLIRSLDLTFVLGNAENVAELEGILGVISNTDFRYHAPAQRLRLAHDRASQADTAEFLYYDPWKVQVLSHSEYVAMRTRGRVQMPPGHPAWFNWEREIPGWNGRSYVRPAGSAVGEDVVPKVEYFGPEHIKNAPRRFYAKASGLSNKSYQGAYFGASDVNTAQPVNAPVAYVQGGGVSPPPPGINASGFQVPDVSSTPGQAAGADDSDADEVMHPRLLVLLVVPRRMCLGDLLSLSARERFAISCSRWATVSNTSPA